MRQPSLFELVKGPQFHPPTTPAITTEPLEVYDFFAGAGGFSTGARQAGCRVVYVCDNNAEALATHKRNHPEAEHACLTLPSAEAVAKLPTDGRTRPTSWRATRGRAAWTRPPTWSSGASR